MKSRQKGERVSEPRITAKTGSLMENSMEHRLPLWSSLRLLRFRRPTMKQESDPRLNLLSLLISAFFETLRASFGRRLAILHLFERARPICFEQA